MKTCVIFHEVDLDGFMSAAIVKYWFNQQEVPNKEGEDCNTIDFIGYNYGQPIPDLSEYDKIIMCDISFPIEEMEKLAYKLMGNFIWIDHHISAINSWKEGLVSPNGLRDTKFAACELTWFYMNNPINNAVIDLTSFKRYEEKWININDIYSISNYGRVLSKEREVNHIGGKAYRPNKILKHIIDAHGYSRVTINGVSEHVHKLVAKYFLTGSGETVNHIDGNKENNCVSNLEYTSYKENNIHAIENGLRTSGFEHWQSKTVEQYKDNILINTFGSTTEASKETGISQGNIAAVCRYYQGIKSKFRNRTQAGGFVFKYKDEVKEETRFERSTLKRNINIGSILSQSDSLELDSNEKEVHKFFNTPEIVRLLGRYDCFGHRQIWKSVVDHEGLYEVSNRGNIRSLHKETKELSIANSKRGYRVVSLYKDGNATMKNVHQLVAQAFIPNPDNKPCINHKDFNRLNNYVENLEWCTYAENNLHSIEEGKKGRTVIQFTKDGEFVQQFDSIKRAESHTGIASQNIGKVCKGEREFAGEYKWEYGVDKDVFPQFVPEDEEQKVLEFQYGARQCISNYEEAYNYLIQCTRAKESEYWRLQAQVVVDSILEQGKAIYQYLYTEAKQSYKNGFEINFSPIKDKVFLGGTCNNSSWRSELIPMLCINYFNPVVEDWTPDCQQEEYRQKEQECNIHLYVITKEMTGVFSIAEVIDSVHSNKETIFVVNPDGFDNRQLKSLQAVLDMVLTHGGKGKITNNINDIALLINRLESDTFTKSSKFICINKERFNPVNFGIDYHKDGYDGAACFYYDGQRKLWAFSLYNDNGLVDCSAIAKQYGGGGHRGASGFVTKDLKGIIE